MARFAYDSDWLKGIKKASGLCTLAFGASNLDVLSRLLLRDAVDVTTT